MLQHKMNRKGMEGCAAVMPKKADRVHIIEEGDTLYKIGKRYGVPISSLIYANPYLNVYDLQKGDQLLIRNPGKIS